MDRAAAFAQLRDILAGIFDKEATTRVIASDAGLNLSLIEFSGTAVLTWHSVLRQAEYQSRISRLFEVVVRRYPKYSPMHDAIRDYCESFDAAHPVGLLPAKVSSPGSPVADVGSSTPGASEPLSAPRPSSNVWAWLKRVGFVADPFATMDASHEATLPYYFVETPLYFELTQGSWAVPALLIRGETGTGKSALRRMLTNAWQPTYSTSTVLTVEVAVGCWLLEAIEHDWHTPLLPQFLGSVMRGSVESIVHALLVRETEPSPVPKVLIRRLKTFWLTHGVTAHDPAHFFPAFRDSQVDMLQFTEAWKSRRLSSLLAATSGWDRPGWRRLAVLVDAQPIRLARESPLAGILYRQLVEVAASLGLSPIQLLVDCPYDSVGPLSNIDAAAARLAPIVNSSSLINIPDVAFRFFFAPDVAHALQQLIDIDPSHFGWRDLVWREADLRQLLMQRLSAFSNGKIADIAQLCDEGFAPEIELLLRHASGGVPRKLLRILENLIVTHCLRAGDQLHLTRDDWEAAMLAFDTSYDILSKQAR